MTQETKMNKVKAINSTEREYGFYWVKISNNVNHFWIVAYYDGTVWRIPEDNGDKWFDDSDFIKINGIKLQPPE